VLKCRQKGDGIEDNVQEKLNKKHVTIGHLQNLKIQAGEFAKKQTFLA
jgi:hypothetical protein